MFALLAASAFFCTKAVSQAADRPEVAATFSTNQLLKDTVAILQQLAFADSIVEINTDSALVLISQAIASSRQLNYRFGIAKGFDRTGIVYLAKGNYPTSISQFRQAIAMYSKAGSQIADREKMYSLVNIASAYWYYGKADSTAFFCYQALSEVERLKITQPSLLLHVYSKTLHLWINLNDDPSGLTNDKYMQHALNYLNKAELINHPDKAMTAEIAFSKGQLKEMQQDYDSARYFYQHYMQLLGQGAIHKGRSLSWASAMLLNISNTFLQQHQSDSAIWYAQEAVKNLPADHAGSLATYHVFAGYYMGKALCQQKKYREAIATLLPALSLAEEKKLFFMRQIPHEVLAEAYRETGDLKAALQHQTAYYLIKDSLLQKSKIQTISQMEARYQVVEKNQQLAEKELDIVKKSQSIRARNIWIACIGAVLILLLLAVGLWYRQQQMRALQVSQQQLITNLQASISGEEKERSRLARELHDGIGGTLGAIQIRLGAAIRENGIVNNTEFKNILNLLAETYTDLRRTSHNLMPETLRQQGLVQAVELFCDGVSKGAPPTVAFEVVGNIPNLSADMELAIYRIVQELVNNILKHAKATSALVQLSYAHQTLTLTVEDDGIGMDRNTAVKKQGIGMDTIMERVNSLGGSLDISSQPGEGCSIYIEFPLG